mmetsp:Transcript_32574/g.70410  ORF Transcript_32574/g.70410 Transcript_32574/m.70410 type:complete len:202 (-) Transcript_32574:318-923(-)
MPARPSRGRDGRRSSRVEHAVKQGVPVTSLVLPDEWVLLTMVTLGHVARDGRVWAPPCCSFHKGLSGPGLDVGVDHNPNTTVAEYNRGGVPVAHVPSGLESTDVGRERLPGPIGGVAEVNDEVHSGVGPDVALLAQVLLPVALLLGSVRCSVSERVDEPCPVWRANKLWVVSPGGDGGIQFCERTLRCLADSHSDLAVMLP